MKSRIRYRRNALEGWFEWPADPLFRPSIGIFAGDRLLHVVSTRRVRQVRSAGTELPRGNMRSSRLGGVSSIAPDMEPDRSTADRAAMFRRVLSGVYAAMRTQPFIDDMGSLVPESPGISIPEDHDAQFVCWFRAENLPLAQWTSSSQVSVSCLETGAVLRRFESPNARDPGTFLSVDDIIRAAETAATAWDSSGFLSFLNLPVNDQLQILYLDLLGRGADPVGIASYYRQIREGTCTILDVRDRLLGSEEFRQRSRTVRSRRVGGWCVWGGLASPEIELLLTSESQGSTTRMSEFGRYLDVVSEFGELGDHLRKLAVGIDGDDATGMLWRGKNAGLIENLQAEVESRKVVRERSGGGRDMAWQLLPRLSVGSAGKRTGARIESRPGIGGHVAYGPYLMLEPGAYRVGATVRAKPAADCAEGTGIAYLEVVSDTVLFGCIALSPVYPYTENFSLDFVIPEEASQLLRRAKYEIRVWVDGHVDVELHAVVLRTLSNGEAPLYPSVRNWLPMLSVGGAGQRLASGHVTSRGARLSGHIVFGPHLSLLPNAYTLVASMSGEFTEGSKNRITLEVVGPGQAVLASRRFRLSPGDCELRLPFEIDQPGSMEDLSRPLEFRVAGHDAGPYRIRAIRLAVRSGDEVGQHAGTGKSIKNKAERARTAAAVLSVARRLLRPA